jgi:hypothetical protein
MTVLLEPVGAAPSAAAAELEAQLFKAEHQDGRARCIRAAAPRCAGWAAAAVRASGHLEGAGDSTQFTDRADCPQMVVIPPDALTMGSPPAERSAEAQHRVTLAAPRSQQIRNHF